VRPREAGGVAPVLRCDLPSRRRTGENFVELDIEDDDGILVEAASGMPTTTAAVALAQHTTCEAAPQMASAAHNQLERVL